MDEESGPRLLGDIELLIILHMPFDLPAARRRLKQLARQASHDLSAAGRPLAVDCVPAGIDYLQRNIRPCIFAFDLKTHGRVLWGERDVLERLKPMSAAQIPADDAVKLIMNRTVELLLLDSRDQVTDADRLQIGYQVDKTILDLAGSALAFAGQYVSLYSERNCRFRELVKSDADLASALDDGGRFTSELAFATECKVRPTRRLLLRGDLRERSEAALRWAMQLWSWEMMRWTGRPGASYHDLVDAYVHRDGPFTRTRDWVKYWRHPLRPRRPMNALRAARLLATASPHALTYGAAMLAVASRLEGRDDWAAEAASLLPMDSAGADAALREAGETWTWLIRNN